MHAFSEWRVIRLETSRGGLADLRVHPRHGGAYAFGYYSYAELTKLLSIPPSAPI